MADSVGIGGWDFFGLTLMADVARHPGVVACAASGRGQGLAQPLAPYDPQPRVGAAIPDGQHGYARRTVGLLSAARQRAFGLPLSRAHAGRASVRRRSFRPCGAAISSAPCLACVNKPESLFPLRKRYTVPCYGAGKTAFRW